MFLKNNLRMWHISCLTALPPDPDAGGSAGLAPGARNPGRGPATAPRLPLWRRARRRFYWLLVLAVAGVAELLPVRIGRASGVRLARMALRVRGRERRLAEANLALALPDLEPAARVSLLAASADAAGRNLFDTLAAGRLLARPGSVADLPDADGRGLVDVVAAEQAAGRGVVVLSGHLGCWELHGAWLARELAARGCGPLHAVAGTVRNPAVDRWLTRRREGLGLRLLRREDGAGPVLECLRAGGVVAILVDQNTGVDSVPVPFLGRPAPTPTGPARLAVAARATVVVTALARRDDGSGHDVWHAPAWRADAAAPRDGQVVACLRWVNGRLEERIRRNPAEWVWYHRRWESLQETTAAAENTRT